MIDPTKRENEMLLEAGKNGGEYLDEIQKYDLRYLTKDEWLQFLRSVVGKWGEILVREEEDPFIEYEIPF